VIADVFRQPVTWFGAASRAAPEKSAWRRVDGWSYAPHGLEVDLQITNRCPLSCDHCVYDSSMHASDGLPLDTVARLAHEFRALGVSQVSITGGEPFIRRDLPDVIRLLADLDVEVCVQTSGLLADRTDFGALRAVGLDLLLVSIDGLAPFHDSFRHHRGLFDLAVKAAGRATAAALPVRVNVVVSRANRSDAVALLPLLRERGVRVASFFYLSPVGRGAQHREQVLTFTEWAAFEDGIASWCERHAPLDDFSVKVQRVAVPLDRIPEGGQRCRIRDRDNILILANGDVYPCVFLCEQPDLCLGNIFREPLAQLWRGGDRWTRAYDPFLATAARDCEGHAANRCSGGCPAFRRLLRRPRGHCDDRCEHAFSSLAPDCAREYTRFS
jgi:radical SAM protein with 4Fe4S-binding SPASM domain